MLALRLPEEIERRLEALAKSTGRSKFFYAREAILEYLDDLEAAYLPDEILKRIDSGEERTLYPRRIGAQAWSGGLKSQIPPRSSWLSSTTGYQAEILRYLRERIATDEDQRRYGKPLRGDLAGRWKYRVGTYGLICDIQNKKVLVLVLMVGHRNKVYGGH